MEVEANYLLIWIVYLIAGAIFYGVFWLVTKFNKAKWTSYSLRAAAAAIILTPWYANIQGETMAPALMVMTLDLITIGGEAVPRSAIPLVLAIIASQIVVAIIYFIQKNRAEAVLPKFKFSDKND
ncbi:MAG: hypothetical protein VYE30_05960 [Pseudomonadota bacterium]|nr:hypothetical protein [Pseudomonadota bacterium]